MTRLLPTSSGARCFALAIAISATLAACATQEPPTAKPQASAPPRVQPAPPPPAAAAVRPAPAPAASTAATTTLDGGLRVIDRKVGNGKEAAAGKAAMVQYTGWLYDEKAPDKKGKQFDSSSKREGGLPFGFIVGVGKVIKGWDQGVPGMKVGGSRTLIVPAALGYGERDVGNGLIPPNSTLIFDIDLIDVKP